MNFDYHYFIKCLTASFLKIPVTLEIAGITMLIGLVFGTLIALCRVYHVKILDPILTILVAIVKAIPVNLIILIFSLVFNEQFNHVAKAIGLSITVADVNKITVAILAISIAATAVISESVRGALMAIDQGQYEAGFSVGLTGIQTFFRIILPQAFLVLLPALIGNLNSLIKLSSLVILVGVMEVLNSSVKIASSYYCYLEAYLAAGMIYWLMSMICIQTGKVAESRLGRFRRTTI